MRKSVKKQREKDKFVRVFVRIDDYFAENLLKTGYIYGYCVFFSCQRQVFAL